MQVDVYENGNLSATVPIIGQSAGYPAPPMRQDLSAYHNVTKIVIREISDDPWGISWDDFVFVPRDEQPPQPCAAPAPDEVVIYEDAGHRGRCVVKGIGRYDDAAAFGPLRDDSASSIEVGGDVEAVLASATKLGGERKTFTASDDDFSDDKPIPGEEHIGGGTMSSFKVQRRGSGSWWIDLATDRSVRWVTVDSQRNVPFTAILRRRGAGGAPRSPARSCPSLWRTVPTRARRGSAGR